MPRNDIGICSHGSCIVVLLWCAKERICSVPAVVTGRNIAHKRSRVKPSAQLIGSWMRRMYENASALL
ncbi:hypothetical protein IG631_03105 [Alternaria alternata]|nr:hypothetical protein IG631_03105 [Alternaria alternata]